MSFDDLDLARLRTRRSEKWTVPPDVLPLWVAEMDFDLAPPISAELHALVDRSDTGYAPSRPLVAAFAAFAARRYAWRVDGGRAWAAPDVMAAVDFALRRLTEPGDPIAFLTPAYPPFYVAVDALVRRVVGVPMLPDDARGWLIDLDALRAALRAGAKAILMCNPHNPTGRAFDRDDLQAVADLAAEFGVPVISDEIHAPLVLAGRHVAFEMVSDRCVCVHSASKGWNLPGLKAAIMVAGAGLVDELRGPAVEHLDQNAGIAGMIAGVAAFESGEPWLEELLEYLRGSHALLRELLPAALPGVRVTAADATYLMWLDLREVAGLGPHPATELLERARVRLEPGERFGAAYPGFVRLNLATSRPILREAVERIGNAVAAGR